MHVRSEGGVTRFGKTSVKSHIDYPDKRSGSGLTKTDQEPAQNTAADKQSAKAHPPDTQLCYTSNEPISQHSRRQFYAGKVSGHKFSHTSTEGYVWPSMPFVKSPEKGHVAVYHLIDWPRPHQTANRFVTYSITLESVASVIQATSGIVVASKVQTVSRVYRDTPWPCVTRSPPGID